MSMQHACTCSSERARAASLRRGGRDAYDQAMRPPAVLVCAPLPLQRTRARSDFEVGAGAAHDLDTLLHAFLDELLFTFLTELFVCKHVAVTHLARGPAWTLTARGCAPP